MRIRAALPVRIPGLAARPIPAALAAVAAAPAVLAALAALAALASVAVACQPAISAPATAQALKPVAHDAADAVVASSDGVPIRYHAEGTGEPALVFIHGWSCDRSHWDEQVRRFSAVREVISLDLAGHGDSGKDRRDWTLASLGADVRAVVLTLDVKKVVLIGHSMGGPVALEAAAAMPDRVVAVVGIDTFHDVERHPTPEQTQKILQMWETDYAGTAKKFVDSLLPANCPAAVHERLQAEFANAPPDVALALFRTMFAYDEAAAFDRVRVPIRAINTTLPTDVAADRRHCADFAAVDLTPYKLGHFPMLTAPDLFDIKLAETLTALGVPTRLPPSPPPAAPPAARSESSPP